MEEYKLANNPLLLVYYKRQTGRELTVDLTKYGLIAKKLEGKGIEEYTEEDINSLSGFDIYEILINIFFAARCAYECKLLDFDKVISEELKTADLLDPDFATKLIELISVNVKKN